VPEAFWVIEMSVVVPGPPGDPMVDAGQPRPTKRSRSDGDGLWLLMLLLL
jgi:hypothetical protein